MRNTVNVLGVNVDKVTFAEAVDIAEALAKAEGVSAIFTPNPEIIMAAKADSELCEILNSADLCTADGIGVVYGSKILCDPVPERVAGFDVTCALLERLSKTGEGIFLFGAKPGVAEKAKAQLEARYKGIVISGTRNGYFSEADEDKIVEEINASGAKVLLVCLGAPKQEKWINKHRAELKVNLCLGVGGTLDVLSGETKRAPEIFIKLNMEWAYRIATNPTRIGRFAALPKFVAEVLSSRKK